MILISVFFMCVSNYLSACMPACLLLCLPVSLKTCFILVVCFFTPVCRLMCISVWRQLNNKVKSLIFELDLEYILVRVVWVKFVFGVRQIRAVCGCENWCVCLCASRCLWFLNYRMLSVCSLSAPSLFNLLLQFLPWTWSLPTPTLHSTLSLCLCVQ